MDLNGLFQNALERFRDAGFASPDVEAAYLAEETAHLHRYVPMLHGSRELTDAEEAYAQDYLKRRLANEPFQYICGHAEFRELSLLVSPACLIPRPETEFLADLVLKNLPPNATVCELGTGSGALALSIAYERSDTLVYASEISPDALAVAKENGSRYQLGNVRFFQGDLFSPFPPDLRFDRLMANLPYIPESAAKDLPPNVRDFEPGTALFAPHHGMALIERALAEAPDHLRPGADLYFEMGEEQGEALSSFARKTGKYDLAEVLKDQYGVNRFLHARCL